MSKRTEKTIITHYKYKCGTERTAIDTVKESHRILKSLWEFKRNAKSGNYYKTIFINENLIEEEIYY